MTTIKQLINYLSGLPDDIEIKVIDTWGGRPEWVDLNLIDSFGYSENMEIRRINNKSVLLLGEK